MKDAFDLWEDKFFELCQDKLDEEPIYDYQHLFKNYKDPEKAFEAYLKENPDYAEKYEEINSGISLEKVAITESESLAFLEMAKKLEEKKKEKAAKEKIANHISKYCPDCGRVLGSKKLCKCGYRRK